MSAPTGVLQEAIVWLNDPLTWTEPGGILELAGEHLVMTAIAVAVAAAVAIPTGAWLGHSGRGAGTVVWLTNASRAARGSGVCRWPTGRGRARGRARWSRASPS